MFLALPLVTLCLTAGELPELAGLPPPELASACYYAADRFVGDLVSAQLVLGGYKAEQLGEVLDEARPLREWWRLMWWATDRTVALPTRAQMAREARALHDWRRHGLPPFVPFWRLPCR